MIMVLLTVFTPTYNRAHTLPRTYESLCAQDCKDFKWLIVDDGSVDHTAELVKAWKNEENGFEIQYVYKENGGMHTAHNTAYENKNFTTIGVGYYENAHGTDYWCQLFTR